MKEQEIVQLALENLQGNTGIAGKWKDIGPKDLDGHIEIKLGTKTVKFNTEILRELRNHQLPRLFDLAERFRPLIVVANHIFPKIKEELRGHQIGYLETNGNICFTQNEHFIWIDTNKPLTATKEKGNRAFAKTGLKVIFHFLMQADDVNLPYRQIAAITQVGLGNINYVIAGLKEMGFLINVNKNTYKLINKKQLLEKWMPAYDERLKPTLKVGTFRFLKEGDFALWKKLQINTAKTVWGGEPAGAVLTDYLMPAELTLYTTETRSDLIKNYRLIPDEKGNVKAYQKFWHYDEVNWDTAPPVLVYTDLMNTNDRRCTETAEKIYDEILQNKF